MGGGGGGMEKILFCIMPSFRYFFVNSIKLPQ